jgi:LysM repeat protein
MFVKLISATLVALVIWAVAARSSDSAATPQLYVVKPHDTLWSIATRHYAGDPRDVIYRLEERNHLAGAVVWPGQRLVLP